MVQKIEGACVVSLCGAALASTLISWMNGAISSQELDEACNIFAGLGASGRATANTLRIDYLRTLNTDRFTLVEMSDEFKGRVIQGYEDDPRWVRIKQMVEDNAHLRENAAALLYKMVKGMMYFDDPEQGKRLCIP